MNSRKELPDWLNQYIFGKLRAHYHCRRQDAEHNRDAGEEEVKEYMGTYFPRSYCEVCCIAENLFGNEDYKSLLTDSVSSDRVINILDLGCGTGGDIVGLLSALCGQLPSVDINVRAFDANETALRYMSDVVNAFARESGHSIYVRPEKFEVNSESDFQSLAESIGDSKFDYILCCKACGELWSSHIVGEPYMAVAELFSEKLKDYGAMLILDVASQPGGCPKYLPEEMNEELNAFAASHGSFCTLVPRPCAEHPECSEKKCYMLKYFLVSHSGAYFLDGSNVCYRIICRKELRDQMRMSRQQREQVIGGHIAAAGQNQDKAYIIHDGNKRGRRACPWFKTGEEADAFDINS